MTGGPYQVVNVRGWPGLGSYQAPRVPAADVPRLGERNDLVLVAAGAAGNP